MKKYSLIISMLFGMIQIIITGCNKSDPSSKTEYANEIGGEKILIDSTSISRMEPLCFPDTTEVKSNFYYRVNRVELDSKGSLILADNSLNNIHIVDPNNGKKILSFGNRGNGPGEFQFINEIIFDPSTGIIVIDNMLLRATIFNEQGKQIKSIPLRNKTDDIELSGDSLIATSFELRPSYKTVKISSLITEKELSSFGPILEPKENIFQTINKIPNNSSLFEWFSFKSMMGLLYLKDSHSIILSQKHPYALWSIDLSNHEYKRFNQKVPFSTFSENEIKVINNGEGISRSIVKSGIQLHPQKINDRIITLIFDKKNLVNFLDQYDLRGVFLNRFKLPSLKSNLWVNDFVIDANKGIIYLLVADTNFISWIERFKIIDNFK